MDLMDDGPISLLGLRPQTFSQQIIFFCFFYSVINCVDMSCISSVFDFTGHRAFFWFLSALLLFSILLFKWCNSWCTQRGCVVPLVAKPAETFQNLPPSLLLLNIVPQCVWVRRHGRSFKTLKKKKNTRIVCKVWLGCNFGLTGPPPYWRISCLFGGLHPHV